VTFCANLSSKLACGCGLRVEPDSPLVTRTPASLLGLDPRRKTMKRMMICGPVLALLVTVAARAQETHTVEYSCAMLKNAVTLADEGFGALREPTMRSEGVYQAVSIGGDFLCTVEYQKDLNTHAYTCTTREDAMEADGASFAKDVGACLAVDYRKEVRRTKEGISVGYLFALPKAWVFAQSLILKRTVSPPRSSATAFGCIFDSP
jgi:hypothetical protein